ncbi:ribonuclease H-like domain-containing protein [Sphaerosporella brunnea]|uniref:ribonuclease H n=1 Tax=Sphaerosporella brunnea TaxID=1250544 RepID=A0A5J5FBQ1_9PEZI|nr:ribonuclease H-like domain-containing protein [Sphaerosporella brunnea]
MVFPPLSTQPLPIGTPSKGDRADYNFNPLPHSIADNVRLFHPPHDGAHPAELFSVGYNKCSLPGCRFIRTDNPRQMLMFIDGACTKNGNSLSRGGCGVVYTSKLWQQPISFPLEDDGIAHTNNRAELRAATLAIGMRVWNGEGFNKVVLACNSEYVVKGVCEWLNNWVDNGWKNALGLPVKNRDLWELLLEKLRFQESMGVLVQFWQIPREWNEADPYAKLGAKNEKDRTVGPVMQFQLMERLPEGPPPTIIFGWRDFQEMMRI